MHFLNILIWSLNKDDVTSYLPLSYPYPYTYALNNFVNDHTSELKPHRAMNLTCSNLPTSNKYVLLQCIRAHSTVSVHSTQYSATHDYRAQADLYSNCNAHFQVHAYAHNFKWKVTWNSILLSLCQSFGVWRWILSRRVRCPYARYWSKWSTSPGLSSEGSSGEGLTGPPAAPLDEGEIWSVNPG